MGRKRTLEVMIANIRLHDLSKSYSELISTVFRTKLKVNVRGDRYITMRSLSKTTDRNGRSKIRGIFTTFTMIDFNSDWYSEESNEILSTEDIKNLSIPKDIHPNTKSFFFNFYEDTHKLVFEHFGIAGRLVPNYVRRYLDAAFKQPQIQKRFGPVEVDIVSDQSAISHVFSIERLTEIKIILKVPNADDLDEGLEERVMERLKKQKAKSETTILKAANGESLEPSAETQEDALVATRNGDVITLGKNKDRTNEIRQLSNHPHKEAERYDPDLLLEEQVFSSLADRTLRSSDAGEDEE